VPGAAETLFVSVVGGIATGLIGLVGLHFQQRLTGNAQQISATLAELENMTQSCAVRAIEAWSSPGEPTSAASIDTICQLHAIGEFVAFITARVSTSALRLNSALVNFRQATTGGDFDVRDRVPNPDQAIAILSTAASLRIALREVDYERRRVHLPF
jgi:hypothetical protein